MADGDKLTDIAEFMTGWEGLSRPGLQAWGNRRRDQLIGTVKSTHYQPKFRPLDFLEAANIPVAFLENDDHQIGIEAVVGTQDCFHRYVDTDMIYFQYCGDTRLETEFGIYHMNAGELLLLPAGISCRSTGSNDSLRYWARCHAPITEVRDEAKYTSETHFRMSRTGGPDWATAADSGAPSTGAVIERMHCWHDTPEDETIAQRDYDYLVGAASMKPGAEVSGIRKVRPFDYFEDISGKGNGSPYAIMSSVNLKVRTYNITGEQFAFHRALRSEEVRIQFRSDAIEICEYETDTIRLGEVTIIPRGISHSVIVDPLESLDFLRLNFYSALPWRVPHDLTQHHSDSHFQVETNLVRDADWRKGLAAE